VTWLNCSSESFTFSFLNFNSFFSSCICFCYKSPSCFKFQILFSLCSNVCFYDSSFLNAQFALSTSFCSKFLFRSAISFWLDSLMFAYLIFQFFICSCISDSSSLILINSALFLSSNVCWFLISLAWLLTISIWEFILKLSNVTKACLWDDNYLFASSICLSKSLFNETHAFCLSSTLHVKLFISWCWFNTLISTFWVSFIVWIILPFKSWFSLWYR